MEKIYNFKTCENKWQQFWQVHNLYKWNPKESRENNFVIDTPPPTVSGSLHIGHVFSYTQADFIARFQRMIGKNVFYPMGFDDNGLPTERLVEKEKSVKGTEMKRSEFVELCQEVVVRAEEQFRDLFKKLAISVDWSEEYQTISSRSRKLSQMSFLDLINKGQIYRDEQPILWDPVDRTAIAQAEIEDKVKPSIMNDIKFTTENGQEIRIATTRPELLPACVAVFFNPADKRYQSLKGKYAITPLFGVKVPIIADEAVNIEKGTGLVMCCTFGDTTDLMWWKKHKLPLRVIITKEGRISNIDLSDLSIEPNRAKKYLENITGLRVKEARNKIREILSESRLLLAEENITHTVKCAERSGAPLEILTTPQWFIKSLEHKEALLQKSKELNWYPKSMKIKLDSWIESLSWDWCISRQRFFGVPFPVWFSKRAGEEGKVLLAEFDQLPVDPLTDLPKGYTHLEVEPDTDVMDTWATSGITPQLNSYGISEEYMIDKDRHNKLFPADLRPQAHEIIRTWAFGTMLKSYLHEGKLPWKNIMISGWCLAEDKTKMSKSKGNVITPDYILSEYGTDVVRYWASTSRLGADTAYSEEVMKNGKRLINKLWNAAKLISINIGKVENSISLTESLTTLIKQKKIYCQTDFWILAKLQNVIKTATEQFNNFEYSNARSLIEEFFWRDFCDNYLEIVKVRAYNQDNTDNEGQISCCYTMYNVFDNLLRLFSPFIPHICEELFQKIYSHNTIKSVNERGMWPVSHSILEDEKVFIEIETLITILDLVRKAKAEKNLSVKALIKTLEVKSKNVLDYKDSFKDLQNVINARQVTFVNHFKEKGYVVTGADIEINIVFEE